MLNKYGRVGVGIRLICESLRCMRTSQQYLRYNIYALLYYYADRRAHVCYFRIHISKSLHGAHCSTIISNNYILYVCCNANTLCLSLSVCLPACLHAFGECLARKMRMRLLQMERKIRSDCLAQKALTHFTTVAVAVPKSNKRASNLTTTTPRRRPAT